MSPMIPTGTNPSRGRRSTVLRWSMVALLASIAALPPVLAPTVSAVTSEPGQRSVSESLRVLFARAETVYRSSREDSIEFFDRIVETLERESSLDDEGQLLLRRSLVYRTVARWESGERDSRETDAQLDRIIDLDPTFEFNNDTTPARLADRMEVRRERKVGFLRISVLPADAEVEIDGRVLEPIPDLLSVLAGDHVIVAERSGHASLRVEAEVTANRVEAVGLVLERSSTAVQIATIPAGVTVLIDGQPVGETRPATPDWRLVDTADSAAGAASAPLHIDGLLPGSHEVELRRDGYRTYRSRADFPDLADYSLGVVSLARSEGLVVLRGLPEGARLVIDGEQVQPQGAAGTPPRVTLSVGDHQIVVSHNSDVFERDVSIGEGDTLTIDIDLRAGLAFIGVVGGDEIGRDSVRGEIARGLSASEEWFLLDRSAGRALRQVGVDADMLGSVRRGNTRQWRGARERIEAQVSAALLVFAELSDERSSSSYTLWTWAAGGAVGSPSTKVLPFDDRDALRSFVADLDRALPGPLIWLGARMIDSELGADPIVVDVAPNGPAERAGLEVGDEILTVDSARTATVAAVLDALDGHDAFSALRFEYRRGEDRGSLTVSLRSGPQVAPLTDRSRAEAVVWAAARTADERDAGIVPRWILRMTMAGVLMRAGSWGEAASVLQSIDAPQDAPFGNAAVDYWLGLALLAAEGGDLDAARSAFQRAAANPHATLFHNDGPLVAPRARARLAQVDRVQLQREQQDP